MRQVSVKELGKSLAKELADLPLEITKYGQVIGVITDKGTDKGTKEGTKGTDNKPKGTDLSLVSKKAFLHPQPKSGIR